MPRFRIPGAEFQVLDSGNGFHNYGFPVLDSEMDFRQWIPDSYFSGSPDSNAQYPNSTSQNVPDFEIRISKDYRSFHFRHNERVHVVFQCVHFSEILLCIVLPLGFALCRGDWSQYH